MLRHTALLACCSLLLAPAALHAAAAPPPVTTQELVSGLYFVPGGGGANSMILTGSEGTLVVDAKLDLDSATAELALIDKLQKGPLRYLVNTHVHPDHTGGNEAYGKRGAVIIARDETRAILAAGQRGGPPAPAAALPTLTFDGSAPLKLHLNGETVILRQMPAAHTTDNVIVQFVNANVFQLGDTFSASRYPVLAGGTWQGFIDATEQALALANDNSRFIPGNGDVEGIKALRAWRDMLMTVKANVAALVKEGKTLEATVAAKPTAAFDATYGSPDRIVPALYQELGGSVAKK